MRLCMGDCEEHSGEVRLFRVTDPVDNFDWGIYAYCEEAVKEDTRKGFKLEEASPDERAEINKFSQEENE